MCIWDSLQRHLPQAIRNKQSAEGLRISRFKVQVFYNKLEHTSTDTISSRISHSRCLKFSTRLKIRNNTGVHPHLSLTSGRTFQFDTSRHHCGSPTHRILTFKEQTEGKIIGPLGRQTDLLSFRCRGTLRSSICSLKVFGYCLTSPKLSCCPVHVTVVWPGYSST